DVVLHVADERLVPVQKIQRAVGSDADRRGTKVRVIRFDQMIGNGLALDPRAFLLNLHAVNALETNHVQVEEIPLKILREMAAGKDARAGTWTRGLLPELPHMGMFGGIIEIAAEGRTKIAVIAGGIGDDVRAPVVKDAAMRISETVSGIALKFPG